jgi:hypothetical protein
MRRKPRVNQSAFFIAVTPKSKERSDEDEGRCRDTFDKDLLRMNIHHI